MAIKKDSLKKMLQQLKVPDAQIAELVDSDEEKDFTVPEGTKIFDAEGYTQLETNLGNKNKNASITAGKEIAIKELKEKAGIDFDGKDPDTFINKFKEHVIAEAKLPADKAKEQWEQEKKTLQQSLAEEKTKVTTLENEKTGLSTDNRILAALPKDRNTNIPDSVHLQTIKNAMGIKKDGDKEYYEVGGKRLQDDSANDMPFDKAIEAVYSGNAWMKAVAGGETPPGGQGFGDNGNTTGEFKTLDDFEKHLAAKGISSGSTEANKMLQDAVTKNPKLIEG